MKKFLSLILLMAVTVAVATAQFSSILPLKTGDTVVNTASVSHVLSFTGGYSGVVIQPIITKISGTVGGTAILSESLDATNYVPVDTISLSNVATNSGIFRVTAPTSVYYKITVTGTGTMSAQVRIRYVARKYQQE